VSRIDQGVDKYDALMTETDRAKQLAYLEKELKSAGAMLEQINYDLKQCNKKKRDSVKGKQG
jgi:hypothetical protein